MQCLFKIKDSDKFCCQETSLNLFDQTNFFHFTPVNPGFQGMHVANKGKASPHFSDICITLYIQKGLRHKAGTVARAVLTTHHLPLQLRKRTLSPGQYFQRSKEGLLPASYARTWTAPWGQGTRAPVPTGTEAPGLLPSLLLWLWSRSHTRNTGLQRAKECP